MLIDGSVVGSIPNNETIDLSVEAGRHTLQVSSMRFLGSPKESFEVADGQVIGLTCRRRARHPFIAQRSIYLLLVSLFKHDVWVSLTPDDTGKSVFEQGNDEDVPRPQMVAAGSASGARAITNIKEITSAPTLDSKAGPAAIAVQQLTKRFGQRTAFSEVSFEVAYGEVFGFLVSRKVEPL